jgi:Holliday junction resolvase RusA-like endonuclease
LRELVYSTTNKDWSELLKGSANGMGITVDCDARGVVDITIPCLIPGRKKKPTEYITAPLYAALEGFIRGRPPDQPFERFERCVICITHVYDRRLIGKGRKRDYDNIETKGIIDVINAFLLTDDSGFFCSVYHTSEISDRDYTRVSVVNRGYVL